MSATNRSLIIPPEVLALPSDIVTWAARLVLSEIIDLYKPHHKVFAKDEHFSKRCVLSMRSVSDAVKQLADAGLIRRVVDQRKPESCRRTITPTVPGMVYPAPTAADSSSLERGHIDRPLAESARGQQKPIRSEALPLADSARGKNTEAEDELPLADSARGADNLSQNLREPIAESAGAYRRICESLSQNLRV